MFFMRFWFLIKNCIHRVPDKFAPTLPSRDWLIHPLGGNPVWTAVVAVVPAVLGSVI